MRALTNWLRGRVVLVGILAVVGGLGALSLLAASSVNSTGRAVHRGDRNQEQQMLAGLTGQYLRFSFLEVLDLANSRHWTLRPADQSDLAALRRFLQTSPLLGAGAVLTDLTGTPLVVAAPTTGLPAPDDPGYGPLRNELLAGRPGLSALMWHAGRPLVAFAVPVEQGGRPVALMIAYADVRSWPLTGYTSQLHADQQQADPGAHYYITDSTGTVVAADQPAALGRPVPGGTGVSGLVSGPGGIASVASSGGQLVVSHQPVGIGGWAVSTFEPSSAFYGSLGSAQLWLVAALVAVLGAAVGALLLLHHRQQLAVSRLAEEAIFDPLTGAATRRLLDLRLRAAVARTTRGGTALAALFCDLDGFKRINDAYGHNAGDRVLALTTTRLRRCVRDDDLVARIGGDEFVVLVESAGSEHDMEVMAQRVVAALAEPAVVGSRTIQVSASVGLAMLPAGSPRHEELLTAADQAMYQAKRFRSGYAVTTLPPTPREPVASARDAFADG